MDPLVKKARAFAIKAHGSQTRKYTGKPYWTHPQHVAKICERAGLPREAIVAAWLHDTVEDTPVTHEDIKREFGKPVADLVRQLTDASRPWEGNRKRRRAIDRAHYRNASALAQSIKLADLISNTADIVVHDPKFAKVYVAEIELLLKYLKHGHSGLYARAEKQVQDAQRLLKSHK